MAVPTPSTPPGHPISRSEFLEWTARLDKQEALTQRHRQETLAKLAENQARAEFLELKMGANEDTLRLDVETAGQAVGAVKSSLADLRLDLESRFQGVHAVMVDSDKSIRDEMACNRTMDKAETSQALQAAIKVSEAQQQDYVQQEIQSAQLRQHAFVQHEIHAAEVRNRNFVQDQLQVVHEAVAAMGFAEGARHAASSRFLGQTPVLRADGQDICIPCIKKCIALGAMARCSQHANKSCFKNGKPFVVADLELVARKIGGPTIAM